LELALPIPVRFKQVASSIKILNLAYLPLEVDPPDVRFLLTLGDGIWLRFDGCTLVQ